MSPESQAFEAIRWENNQLALLDQRKLPLEETWISHDQVEQVVDSIRDMVVRGAPAIGITAAYGVAIAAKCQYQQHQLQWKSSIEADLEKLAGSRPTAINLFWAIDRMRAVIGNLPDDVDPFAALVSEAQLIHQEDIQANLTMGDLGADLIKQSDKLGMGVITHCNTGTLATGGYGTALGVIRSAHRDGAIGQVFADETRPWLQGARLTAWELCKDGIPVTLNADGAAAHLMSTGKIGWVIVGSDRITANGDVANKIGTYSLAVLAKYHGVKFMVVAPTSTFDMSLSSGADIPIEERSGDEVLTIGERAIAPAGCAAFNPVFDVTPAALVDAIVTEKGVIETPTLASVAAVVSAA
ncbi:MAG: S-methyl-5-thioribose-1-phosphate isomerase [Pseudomonadales bacterium]|nr:S-methyl-5-thioribose-1-phosphate isomerase [Pseudomonadales bacterium]